MPTRDTDKGENDKGDKSGDETKMNESLYKTGFYFSPEEHVKLAMRLQHPASEFTLVPAQGNLCAWGALGGGLTAALGALAFSCPVPLCEAVGTAPLRIFGSELAGLPRVVGCCCLAHRCPAAPAVAIDCGASRAGSYLPIFYVRRRLCIPDRQLLACFALRSLAAADAPWPTVVRWLGLAVKILPGIALRDQ